VLVAVVAVAAGSSVVLAVTGLYKDVPTTVTAHRGGHDRAPENTAAAVRRAIELGADYAEIDVQLSKDGVLVVTHDSDFSRLGGVSRKVWELTFDEIRAIPLGAASAPEYRTASAPALEDILDLARGRIRLNIELKYYGGHQPRLAERVALALVHHQMTNQVLIQCLEYEPLLEFRRYAPHVPIGYLMSINAKHAGRLEVDFLGVEVKRVNGVFVHAAHRRGQNVHVWTVDSPADMDRLIALGVDDLITNRPEEALRRVRAFQTLPPSEQALRRIRAWLEN
jgi:glycerophosphoryl diester phosphodiesterase